MSAPYNTEHLELPFGTIANKRTSLVFDQPDVSSDGGTILIKQQADKTNLFARLASAIRDGRKQAQVVHGLETLIAQRVTGLCLGYEDANDCTLTRRDFMMKIACDVDPQGAELGSQPSMSRLENAISKTDCMRLAYALGDAFLESYKGREPDMIVIDVDPSAHLTYGDQQLSLFNTHVDDYCMMPFYVYEGLTGRMITALVRPGKTPSGQEVVALLSRIVAHIRKHFPNTTLVFRADSHHCRREVLDYCEDQHVEYVIGLSPNAVLGRECQWVKDNVAGVWQQTFRSARRFHTFAYKARKWQEHRRVICRAQCSAMGKDLRYIVTSFNGASSKYLYETLYCGRGKAELWIKESKLDLSSDRSSCTKATANQFRLLLSVAAYQLLHGLREEELAETSLARATFGRIRLCLLKVAARVEVGKTFIRLHLPEQFGFREAFARLSAGSRSAFSGAS